MPSLAASGKSNLVHSWSGHGWGRVIDCMADVIAVCTRASAAARHYEERRALSDAALAKRGLTRAGLARAAFDELTAQRQ